MPYKGAIALLWGNLDANEVLLVSVMIEHCTDLISALANGIIFNALVI
tara:strand:- start:12335 stop:12478 length:144 start_codon:yes stop_codon:yes gene_type:complete